MARVYLEKYRKKRDFERTREPRGGQARPKKLTRVEPGLGFVVQKHDARHLHYDFRLELDGALLSWAVPRGPSLDPAVKRLAMEVEPHPLEYADFEGTIPKGEYGGGTVMVWDRGTWQPEGDPRQALAKGHLTFSLFGRRLRGAWHLVRTKRPPEGERSGREGKGWLLFKSRDAEARQGDTLLDEETTSALTGRSLGQIQRGEPRVTQPSAKPASLPETLSPELATLVDVAPAGDGWVHEINLDGYRILARLEHGNVQLLTRNGQDWTDRLRWLADALQKLKVKTAFIDGELVALDEKGISNFQRLQNALSGPGDDSLVYYAFDVVHFVKTTGGKGLHVCIPIAPDLDWEQAKDFTERLAAAMTQSAPELYVATVSKAKRKGKIFIDYLRNGRGATFIAPYSTRARENAPLAVPLEWDELSPRLPPDHFTLRNVAKRLTRLRVDPFERLAQLKQRLRPESVDTPISPKTSPRKGKRP